MRRLKVLLLPHPVAALNQPRAFLDKACSEHHDLTIFDPQAPAGPQLQGKDAVLDYGANSTPELIDAAAEAGVGFIQAVTNGLDHVEVEHILARGITLAHCPGYLSADALAQGAMMFILMLAARYREAATNLEAGTMYFPIGHSLEGKVLLIVGLGATGTRLARLARPAGMRIWAIDVRTIERAEQEELGVERIGQPAQLEELLARCDVLSVNLHLTPQTRHYLDARLLGLMKASAWVINVARGELLDQEALYAMLLDGRLGGAGLDVFETEPPDASHPVFSLPNVYATPHSIGGSELTFRGRALFCAENLDRVAQGQPPLALVTERVTQA